MNGPTVPPIDYTLFTTDMKKIFKMGFMLNGDEDLPIIPKTCQVDAAESITSKTTSKAASLVQRVGKHIKNKKIAPEVPKTQKISKQARDLVQAIGQQLVIKLLNQDLPKTKPANRRRDDSETDGSTSRKLPSFRNAVTFAAVVYDLCFVPEDGAIDITLKKILGEKWTDEWDDSVACLPKRQLAMVLMEQVTLDFNDAQQEIYSSEFSFVESVLEKNMVWRNDLHKKEGVVLGGWHQIGVRIYDEWPSIDDCFRLDLPTAPLRGSFAKLTSIFQKHNRARSSKPAANIQNDLLKFFEEPDSVFGAPKNPTVVVRQNNTGNKDNNSGYELLHIVNKNQIGPECRVAVIAVKRGTEEFSKKIVDQFYKDIAVLLDEHPLRLQAYGIITNGKSFQLLRVDVIGGSHVRHDWRLLKYESDDGKPKKKKKTSAKVPTVADCLVWLLSKSGEDLGCVEWPKFVHEGKQYALGRLLGKGESCGAYTVVPVDNESSAGVGDSKSTKSSAFVVKVFLTLHRADHERFMYEAVANFPNTTKLLDPQPQPLPEFAIAVAPYAHRFRSSLDQDNVRHRRDITAENIRQLVNTVRELHRGGVVHCDIQRTNIMCSCTEPHEVLLNDFGRSWSRQSMRFCDFRILAQRDWSMLAKAMDEFFGGYETWDSIFPPPQKRSHIRMWYGPGSRETDSD